MAVLFVDLDNFKLINDSLGHKAGDDLLRAVAQRFRSFARDCDTAARLGGDEFVLLLEDLTAEEEAAVAAQRLASSLRSPVVLAGQEVVVTASIGVAVCAAGRASADQLMREADIAVYRAKAGGKAQFAVFEAGLEQGSVGRFGLEADLRHALERQEFFLVYQPIVSLDDQRVQEVEALVRWQHPSRGVLLPADFIPIAEETGLIVPLGRWVLESACCQARLWQKQTPGRDGPRLSVNLSAREFAAPDLVVDIRRILQETSFDPERLTLEITESSLIHDGDGTLETMRGLKASGIHLSIDDFGTGYSSLTCLKRFPIDSLKIDREFVSGLGQDRRDTAIVCGVIGLAGTLGLTLTAEGVETLEQAEQLRQLGCGLGQGYLFGRPLRAEKLDFMVARQVSPARRAA